MGLMKDNKVKDYRCKKKLNENERVLIEHYYTKKKIKNYSYIAKEIWRDRKTIEREIKRNRYSNVWWHWVYKADIAQKRNYKRRIKANRKHTKLFTREWRKFVEKIKEAMKKEWWSISASIGRYEYEKNKKTKIAISTMYRYARKYDKELEKMLLYKSWWYRCHPYSSWEKWSVEVHNRYIRRYIPKWVDINNYTDEYIENITKKINRLPRKIHWYRTPEEIFYEKTIKYF